MIQYLWPFLIYWLILFVLCYIVTEFAQNYLYDETTPAVGLKVGLGTMILAAVLTYTRSSFDTMFTSELGTTVVQAIIWFAVFTLVFRFQPQHGAAIGILTMLVVAGLATLGVDSLSSSRQRTLRPIAEPSKPLRRPIGPALKDSKSPEPPASKAPTRAATKS
ncbi:MAG: hypothetical protein IRY99_15085 [Isosphaeraceae bacterium]|nr:hypothetical protein [Isosphaeraceae bacterium]